jgi:hypothetical protein
MFRLLSTLDQLKMSSLVMLIQLKIKTCDRSVEKVKSVEKLGISISERTPSPSWMLSKTTPDDGLDV